MVDQMEKMVEQVFASVSAFVRRSIAPMEERLVAVEQRAPVAGPPGDKGVDGRDGIDGKDGEPGPQGEKGSDGVDGKPGPQGERGEDGRSFGEDQMRSMVDATVQFAFKDLDLKDGAPGPQGEKGEDGRDGRDGKSGPPGRDAVEMDILESFDPQRQYARGTVARYRGGLIRARRLTDAITDGGIDEAGWSVIMNGVDEFSVNHGDDLRTFSFVARCTDGKERRTAVTLPIVLYAGTYEEGREYQRGDQVTDSGSQWIAIEATSDRPRNSKSWRLSTKKGNDGKDATQHVNTAREPVKLR